MRDCDIPDNYDLFERHQAAQDAKLMRRPTCDICGKHIQEDYAYCIDGDIVCEDCLDDYRIPIDDD